MKVPTGWRKGQTIFNFLEWLCETKGFIPSNQQRMADPFHISDEDFTKLYKEFLKHNGTPL